MSPSRSLPQELIDQIIKVSLSALVEQAIDGDRLASRSYAITAFGVAAVNVSFARTVLDTASRHHLIIKEELRINEERSDDLLPALVPADARETAFTDEAEQSEMNARMRTEWDLQAQKEALRDLHERCQWIRGMATNRGCQGHSLKGVLLLCWLSR